MTPSNRWKEKGEPDPHPDLVNKQRHELALGQYTDDELANGAFMNYDAGLDLGRIIANEPDYHPPIAWMMAVKDRIRWLSRRFEVAAEAYARAGEREHELRTRIHELEQDELRHESQHVKAELEIDRKEQVIKDLKALLREVEPVLDGVLLRSDVQDLKNRISVATLCMHRYLDGVCIDCDQKCEHRVTFNGNCFHCSGVSV